MVWLWLHSNTIPQEYHLEINLSALLHKLKSEEKKEKRYLAKKNPTDISNEVFCMFSQTHLEWDDISKWKKNKIEHFPVPGQSQLKCSTFWYYRAR